MESFASSVEGDQTKCCRLEARTREYGSGRLVGTWVEGDPVAGLPVQAEEQRWVHPQGALVEDGAAYHLIAAEPAVAHALAVLGSWAGHTD